MILQRIRDANASLVGAERAPVAIRTDAMNVANAQGPAPHASLIADEYFRLIVKQPELAAAVNISATFNIFKVGHVEDAARQAASPQEHLGEYLGDAR